HKEAPNHAISSDCPTQHKVFIFWTHPWLRRASVCPVRQLKGTGTQSTIVLIGFLAFTRSFHRREMVGWCRFHAFSGMGSINLNQKRYNNSSGVHKRDARHGT
ncbi:MAG TPA: hypothetical protein VG122_22430, partial [Gemmata sp.]|nr:hypothetical protein [Gemmata sp.]